MYIHLLIGIGLGIVILKLFALRKAARNKDWQWFFLLLISPLGILEIFYILSFRKTKINGEEEDPKLPVLFDENFVQFLLKEYENVWGLYRINYDIRDRWIKFYFSADGLGLGAIGAILKFSGKQSWEVGSSIWGIIALILLIFFIFGIAVLFNDIALRKSRAEMFNAINLIRKGFWHNYPKGKVFLYYPTEPNRNSFGLRDFVTTAFLLTMVSINLGALVWIKSKICLEQFLSESSGLQVIMISLISLICFSFVAAMIFHRHNKEIEQNLKRLRLIIPPKINGHEVPASHP